jgi:AraC-like DNA-binding protein
MGGADAGCPPDLDLRLRQLLVFAIREGNPTLPKLARQLGLSVRSLQRRLAACQTTFRDVLDEVRISVAKRYMRETNLPLTRVALIVGYADLTGFSHAFNRTCGYSPRKWRKSADQ